MNFEEYLAEATGSKFAIHLAGKWHDAQSLPFGSVSEIETAVRGEKKNISGLTSWFKKNQRAGQEGNVNVESVTAKWADSQKSTLEVTFKYSYSDASGGSKSEKIKIQNDE